MTSRARTRRIVGLLYFCLLLSRLSVQAQPASLMPDAFPQFFDNNGNPLAGGTLTFYFAGTTFPQIAYSDSDRITAIANPLTLGSDGRPPISIYLAANSYKIVLKDADGITIRTADNVTDANYVAGQALLPTVQHTTATGIVNDFDLSGSAGGGTNLDSHASIVLRCNNAAPLFISGFSFGYPGQRLTVLSVGASGVFLIHQSAASNAVNRMITLQETTPLFAGTGSAEFVYDGTTSRWRMVAAETGPFATYTAAWTGSTTFPALGNGSLSARYSVISRVAYVDLVLFIGSTTTMGTGYWEFGLPMPAVDATGQVGGLALILDSSTGLYSTAVPVLSSNSAFHVQVTGASTAAMSGTAPITWATGDTMRISLWYIVR
jgi:hypothetical protein